MEQNPPAEGAKKAETATLRDYLAVSAFHPGRKSLSDIDLRPKTRCGESYAAKLANRCFWDPIGTKQIKFVIFHDADAA